MLFTLWLNHHEYLNSAPSSQQAALKLWMTPHSSLDQQTVKLFVHWESYVVQRKHSFLANKVSWCKKQSLECDWIVVSGGKKGKLKKINPAFVYCLSDSIINQTFLNNFFGISFVIELWLQFNSPTINCMKCTFCMCVFVLIGQTTYTTRSYMKMRIEELQLVYCLFSNFLWSVNPSTDR